MNRLRLALLMLAAACWSENDFRARCEAAGNCLAVDAGAVVDAGVVDAGVVDAGVVDAGVVDAGVVIVPDGGLSWPAVSAELFDTTNTDSGIEVLVFPVPMPSKSLGGILTPRGTVICIPATGHVLEVFADGGVSSIGFFDGGPNADLWQGGVLLPDGSLFAFPYGVHPPRPLRISSGGLATFAQQVSGRSPVTEGGVITVVGDVIMMPVGEAAFSVWSNATLSRVPVDGGVDATSVAFFSSAVLLGSGTTALAVPRRATAVWTVSANTATPVAPLTGYAGGLLLPSGDAVLMSVDPPAHPTARVGVDGGVSLSGPNTVGYYSAAWSTNGFGYAIQTQAFAGAYLTITRTGAVTESPLPVEGGLPDGGRVNLTSTMSTFSRFGLVAFPDGRLVSCPYSDEHLVFLVPNGRRTVPDWVVLSPWLNKW